MYDSSKTIVSANGFSTSFVNPIEDPAALVRPAGGHSDEALPPGHPRAVVCCQAARRLPLGKLQALFKYREADQTFLHPTWLPACILPAFMSTCLSVCPLQSEKVCVRKLWAATGRSFHHPPNWTNASYYFRTAYEQLGLHKLEEVSSTGGARQVGHLHCSCAWHCTLVTPQASGSCWCHWLSFTGLHEASIMMSNMCWQHA